MKVLRDFAFCVMDAARFFDASDSRLRAIVVRSFARFSLGKVLDFVIALPCLLRI